MFEENERKFICKKDLPYLKKGSVYYTNYETGQIWRVYEDGKIAEHELRQGLSGYIWLLIATGDKYFTEV